jgi:hypothetical protein
LRGPPPLAPDLVADPPPGRLPAPFEAPAALLAPDLAGAALAVPPVFAAAVASDLAGVVFAAARADLAAVDFEAADLAPVVLAAVVLAVEEGEEGLAVEGVVVVDLAAGVAPVSSTLESTSSLGVGSTGGSPPAGGFLPVETTEGRRCSPPWVLMLMVPRHVGRSGGVLADLIWRCLRAEYPALPQASPGLTGRTWSRIVTSASGRRQVTESTPASMFQ